MTARDETICQNTALVHSCARRFIGKGIEYDDLYQAGCIGLIKAVDGFDASRGLCFSTYAVPLILGEIKRLFRDGGTIKISRGLKELSIKLLRTRQELYTASGQEPTVQELAQRMQITPEEAAEALGASLPPLSLTREDTDGEESPLDIPVAGEEESIIDRLALTQVLRELPPNDRSLIVLRYLKRHTQQETALKLGMTQVQVSRRERMILGRLREKMIG